MYGSAIYGTAILTGTRDMGHGTGTWDWDRDVRSAKPIIGTWDMGPGHVSAASTKREAHYRSIDIITVPLSLFVSLSSPHYDFRSILNVFSLFFVFNT